MVTHDPDIARQADRRIELAHGRLHFDTAQHGPSHPLRVSAGRYRGLLQSRPTEDEIRFDHLLEQIWICGEEGKPAQVEAPVRARRAARPPPAAARRAIASPADAHVRPPPGRSCTTAKSRLTDYGSRRARDVVRRHRLAERLFKDTFSIDDSEAHNQACKFEHIISPELDQRICTFLGHPKTCPHGNPIPAGDCCNGKSQVLTIVLSPMPIPIDPRKKAAAVKIHVTTGAGVDITWADGHASHYDFPYLRDECPCATCNDERAKKDGVRVALGPRPLPPLADVQAQSHRQAATS